MQQLLHPVRRPPVALLARVREASRRVRDLEYDIETLRRGEQELDLCDGLHEHVDGQEPPDQYEPRDPEIALDPHGLPLARGDLAQDVTNTTLPREALPHLGRDVIGHTDRSTGTRAIPRGEAASFTDVRPLYDTRITPLDVAEPDSAPLQTSTRATNVIHTTTPLHQVTPCPSTLRSRHTTTPTSTPRLTNKHAQTPKTTPCCATYSGV